MGVCLLVLSGCRGLGSSSGGSTPPPAPPPTATLTAAPATINAGQPSTLTWSTSNATAVSIDNGIGTVAASGTQQVTPAATTTYTITATGNGQTATAQATVTVNVPPPTINSINHIIFHLQENRSFDNYFAKLNEYRATKGLGADVDELNPATMVPSYGGNLQMGPPIPVYHQTALCYENLSASWNETHVDFNIDYQFKPPDQVMGYPMNGWAYTAGKFASDKGFVDVTGTRALGYYDDTQIPYYYFMATQFATSDRFYSPAPSRTQVNRLFAMAATSQGYTFPPQVRLNATTIFQLLDNAHITWKIYTDNPQGYSYLQQFTYFPTGQARVRPLTEYFTDLANGTLPQYAYIDQILADEHPAENITNGANATSLLINAFTASQYYKDSVFVLAWDEAGGTYDHAAPMATVTPDNSPILYALPTDIKGENFTVTGARVPFMVISPWTKPGYVSHTPMDYTVVLKFIETRFGLPNLSARDAAQPDFTEFFDFANTPNAAVPHPPVQPILTNPGGTCPNNPNGD